MQFFEASREAVNACKKLGFTKLEWQYGEINKLTGILEDQAILEGNQFRVYISIEHKELSTRSVNQPNKIPYDFIVNLLFTYDTGFGVMTYSQAYRNTDYDTAKEYAEWQTTLIHKTLQHLDRNGFQIDKSL